MRAARLASSYGDPRLGFSTDACQFKGPDGTKGLAPLRDLAARKAQSSLSKISVDRDPATGSWRINQK